MFEHSVRVPRPYKIAANIFKKVSIEGGSVKTLLYDNKLRHFRTNALYALITQTIKHAAEVDKIFENTEILKNEPRLDPWVAKVLTTELLFGKKALPGKSKPEQTVLSYKLQFEKVASETQEETKVEVRRPRYVRINTNLLSTSDAIRAFQDEEYRLIRCTSGSYDDYLKQIQGLSEYDFTQDYHVKTMFVFSPGTKLHEHELYLENKIILQDKATAMAVLLLAPPPGSVVLDMCAAPGMKTTQLAAFMRNQGKIYAVERNERRYKTLCEFVENTGSKCVETIHKDSLEIKRGDLNDVEYILLDPSCSGSGMELSVHNYIEETRLAKLTSLQEKFLKHAMNAFPKAKRIVYSTCSLYPEENERVITNTVKTSRAKWRVQDVKELLKGQWNNVGSGMYGSMGPRCMYARPESDLTTGFFLAVLDRDINDMEKQLNRVKQSDQVENDNTSDKIKNDSELETKEEKPKKKRKKSKHNSIENAAENDEMIKYILEDDDGTNDVTAKNRHKVEEDSNLDNIEAFNDQNQNSIDSITNVKRKKNKKKDVEDTSEQLNEGNEGTNQENISTDSPKRKKKKKKTTDTEEINETVNIVNSDDETNHKESKRSKKKKRCSKQIENTSDPVDITDSVSSNIDEDNATVTKKKKRKIDQSEYANHEEFVSIKENKKSKKG